MASVGDGAPTPSPTPPHVKAIRDALDKVYEHCDAAVILASYADDMGNAETIMEYIGNMHTLDGLARSVDWDAFTPDDAVVLEVEDDEDLEDEV